MWCISTTTPRSQVDIATKHWHSLDAVGLIGMAVCHCQAGARAPARADMPRGLDLRSVPALVSIAPEWDS